MDKTARERHVDAIKAAKAQLRTLQKGTPHRRDLIRHINHLQKELRIYDFYTQKG